MKSFSLCIFSSATCTSRFAAWKIAVITVSVVLGIAGVVAAAALIETYRRPREKVFHLIN